ncbi:MAG: RND family transporter [Rhodothermaceae bacterium]
MKKFSNLIIRLRWPIIIFFSVVTIFMAMQIPKATMNADMLTYYPDDMPSRVNRAKIENLFGGTEIMMVIIKSDNVLEPQTLKRVKKISREMKKIKGIDKIMSLFELKNIKSEDGAMIVDPAVKKIPKTKKDIEQIKKDIIENDIVYGNVVSEDFTITAVMGTVETGTSDQAILEKVNEILKSTPGKEEVYLGGTPFTRFQTGNTMKKDLGKLLPVGLIVMLIFLFFCFKQLRGVLLPFLVVIMSILFSMGLIPLLGWDFTVLTVLLPVILIAVANDYGIHMIAKYQEENTKGNNYSNKKLASIMFSSLGVPIVLTGITTMVGLLCLNNHILIPAGQLGILTAAGITYALALSLLFIPAITSMLKNAKPIFTEGSKKSLLDNILTYFSNFVVRSPKTIIYSVVIFTLLTGTGIFSVIIDTDAVKFYPEEHPVATSARIVNKHLGGFYPVSVVFKGDIKNPELLAKIDRYEKRISKIPEIGNTLSIARIVRQMSRVLNDKHEPFYDKIPDTRNAVAQYFELYNMSGDPDDFEKLVDFSYEHAVINARINKTSTPILKNVVNQIRELTKDDPDVFVIGGISEIFADASEKVVEGQTSSLTYAFILVTILMIFLFRSFNGGIIATIPLLLSVVILFGLMGIMGIELNIITALLSSIMIGVGIDYTIHFLWRFKEERANGLSHAECARKTLLTTGRGIIFNALSVIIGFSTHFVSGFVPVKFFGFLVVVSIFSCLVGSLIVIPAFCVVFKPKFLDSKISVKQKNSNNSLATENI